MAQQNHVGFDAKSIIIILGVFAVTGLWGCMLLAYLRPSLPSLPVFTGLIGTAIGALGAMLSNTRRSLTNDSPGQDVPITALSGSQVNVGGTTGQAASTPSDASATPSASEPGTGPADGGD